jgi:hypothetical protein
MITYEVSGGILGECRVHGAVETACFVDVALQGVWIVAESRHWVVQARSVTAFSPSIPVAQIEHTLKVVCLPLHRAETAHLPKELSMSLLETPLFKLGMGRSPIYPACSLPVLFGPTRIRYHVLPIVSVHEILQDGTAFPDFELLALLVRVDDGWDATVRVDVEVPLLFLLMFKELDWAYLHAEVC